jgi:hypothetical protein
MAEKSSVFLILTISLLISDQISNILAYEIVLKSLKNNDITVSLAILAEIWCKIGFKYGLS